MNIVIFGKKGYLSNSLFYDKAKKLKIKLLSKTKLEQKKKISEKIDIIIHSLGPNKFDMAKDVEKNLIDKKDITLKLLNFAKNNNVKKIIYISSINIYKKNIKKINLNNPYSKLHIKAEKILKKEASKNLKIMILRVSHLFGIRDTINSKGKFLSVGNAFVKAAVQKTKFIIRNPEAKINILPLNYFINRLSKIINFKKNFYVKDIYYTELKLIFFLNIISHFIKKHLGYYPFIVHKNKKIIVKENLYNKVKIKKKKISLLVSEIESTLNYFIKKKKKFDI